MSSKVEQSYVSARCIEVSLQVTLCMQTHPQFIYNQFFHGSGDIQRVYTWNDFSSPFLLRGEPRLITSSGCPCHTTEMLQKPLCMYSVEIHVGV